MAFEVAVVRRDGVDGEIELGMTGLPTGVTAAGIKIPAGQAHGKLIVSADEKAPRSLGFAKLFGRAQVHGAAVERPVHLASPAWPARDASGEITKPRLMADVPVSVTDAEPAPISVAAREPKVGEAKADAKLTIPLKLAWRSEISGLMRLRAEDAAKPQKERAAVIMVWLIGGLSHIDTYDPKPDSGAEYRGPFKVIPTNVPGMNITELRPPPAKIADKFTLVRSFAHRSGGHPAGHLRMLTGAPDERDKTAPKYPDWMCVANCLRP